MKLIDKDALVAEIERRIASLESIGSENYLHDNCPVQYAMLVTLKSLKFSINTLKVKEIDLEKEEPVSEGLEEAAIRASMLNHDIPKEHLHEYLYNDYGMRKFVEGAKWQKENDEEEKVLTYKHGFDDCKEYIKEVLLSEVLPCFMHGGEADEVVAKLDEVLNQKK